MRGLADKNFALPRDDPGRAALPVGRHRAEGVVRFWIGHHTEYDRLTRC